MNKCYSIATNRTNGRVECTHTQPETNRNILSLRNEMHFSNGILVDWVLFHWSLFVCIEQPSGIIDRTLTGSESWLGKNDDAQTPVRFSKPVVKDYIIKTTTKGSSAAREHMDILNSNDKEFFG